MSVSCCVAPFGAQGCLCPQTAYAGPKLQGIANLIIFCMWKAEIWHFGLNKVVTQQHISWWISNLNLVVSNWLMGWSCHISVWHTECSVRWYSWKARKEHLISQVLLLLQISELPRELEELLPPASPLHRVANYLWGHKTWVVGAQLTGWISRTTLAWCIDTSEGMCWRREWAVGVRLCLDQQWHRGKKWHGIVSTKASRGKTNISLCAACGVFKGHQIAAWVEATPK